MKFIWIPITFGLMMGCGPGTNSISRIEKEVKISDRMAYHQVPAVSIAMINDFQIEWTKQYGVAEYGSKDTVTPQTLFQTGSIGKSLMATAALQLVDSGILSLDTDLNLMLKSWKIPENSFTRRTPVTLRHLLSHTGGVTLPGVIGYRFDEPLPDLHQILCGEPPANTPPILVDQVPGTGFKYSSGGFMIVQQLIMDHSEPGKLFPEIIRDQVFIPAGMSSSTFVMSPDETTNKVAAGHRHNGATVEGKWYRYPEMGMGVFWSTPTDMAKFIIEIMKAFNGLPAHMLSNSMAQTMLTPQFGGRGLGVWIGDDDKDRFHFYHRGAVEGYQTFIVGYPKRGQGAVIMTNSDNGYPLIEEILEGISVEYHWLKGFYF